MKNINWKALLVSIAISLGAGAIAGALTFDSMEQYRNLYHPPLSPPGWLFPIVWSVLFILMGISSYLVYISDDREKRAALKIYIIQLIVNVGWSIIFFNWQAYVLAFVWLLLLWYLIYLTMRQFYQINPVSGLLLLPYLLWVTFAGYLNLAIAIHWVMVRANL